MNSPVCAIDYCDLPVYTASTIVGFTARHEMPDEVAIHRPASPWEDDSEARG